MSQIFFAYCLSLIGLIVFLSLLVRYAVNRRFEVYADRLTNQGMTGKQFTKKAIRALDLKEVNLEESAGGTGGGYFPGRKLVEVERLGDSSLLTLAVSAHEIAHAVQERAYPVAVPLFARLERLVVYLSCLFPPVVLLGFLFYLPLLYGGLGLYLSILLMVLAEVPLEIDASRRAVDYLHRYGEMTENELGELKKLLRLAILTRLTYLTVGFLNLVVFDSKR